MSHALELVNRYYDALNRRDWGTYESLIARDCLIVAPGGFEGRGVEAVKAFDRVWTDAASDFRIETLNQVATGGRVASENIAHGTQTGVLRSPQGDLPPTGRTVRGPYVGMFEVRDGKIVSQTLYFDQISLMQQLGVMPQ